MLTVNPLPKSFAIFRSGPASSLKLAGFLWLIALALLSGCATQLEYRSLGSLHSELPPRVELSNTPFFAQTAHHCGPASLAMLLNANGVHTTPEELAEVTYLPGRAGSLAVELLATPRQFQQLGYQVKPELKALLQEVVAGRPVLVLQNLGLSWLPRWHFAVLIGYDLERGKVLLRSGTTRRQIMNIATFERTWLRGERWAMVVLEPGATPAVAVQVNYLQAALGLEQVGDLVAAGATYQQAIQLWPRSVNAWMAWGNNRYAAKDVESAERAYQRVLELNDRFAPAYNNLAQILLERRQFDRAEQMVREALTIGDGHHAVYEQTLLEIQQLRAAASNRPDNL